MKKPYLRKEIIGNAALYLGDCFEILPSIENIDVTITDPPYDEKTHKGARSFNNKKEAYLTSYNYFNEEKTIRFTQLLKEKTKRWIIMTISFRQISQIENNNIELIRMGVWIKPNAAPQFTGDRPGVGFETIAILYGYQKGFKKWNGGGKHAVWNYPIVKDTRLEGQKPIKLIKSFVDLFSTDEETICDPCMGSGTTGVVCARTNRKFIGVESTEKHFNISCERIAKANLEPWKYNNKTTLFGD
jgi:site-specific DNA-methyltransferase (adenine-specific)